MQAQEDEDDQDDNDSDEDEEDEVEDDMGASDAEILDIVDDVDAQDEQTDGKIIYQGYSFRALIIILDNVSRQLLSFFLSLAHHDKHSYCAHSCHNKLPSSRSYLRIVKFRRWIWISVGNVMQVKK